MSTPGNGSNLVLVDVSHNLKSITCFENLNSTILLFLPVLDLERGWEFQPEFIPRFHYLLLQKSDSQKIYLDLHCNFF